MAQGRLAGQWALITGAGRGVGEAIARALASEGASLVLVARSEEELNKVAESCRANGAPAAEVRPADLTSAQDIDRLAREVLDSHKHLDILVNNAGIAGGGSPLDGDPQLWSKQIDLNLKAPMQLTHHFAPGMVEKKAGLIVNLCSVAALGGQAGSASYCASKFGLRGWSLSCYEALRVHNVKVVAIHPGFVKTQMTSNVKGVDPERMIKPEDVAEAVMLAVRTSASCVPQEITLRLGLPAKVA